MISIHNINTNAQLVALRYCAKSTTAMLALDLDMFEEYHYVYWNYLRIIDSKVLSAMDLHIIDKNFKVLSIVDRDLYIQHLLTTTVVNKEASYRYLDMLNACDILPTYIMQNPNHPYFDKDFILYFYKHIPLYAQMFERAGDKLFQDTVFIDTRLNRILHIYESQKIEITNADILQRLANDRWRWASKQLNISLPLLIEFKHQLYWPMIFNNKCFNWKAIIKSHDNLKQLFEIVPNAKVTIPEYLGEFMSERQIQVWFFHMDQTTVAKHCKLYLSFAHLLSARELRENIERCVDFTMYEKD